MGEVELDRENMTLVLHADVYLYGEAAGPWLAAEVASDIAAQWNEPGAMVGIGGNQYRLNFRINGFHAPGLTPLEVYQNTDPRRNYFRVEEHASGNISFVDGINSNTGYFKLDNLLNNSTTAAHEFGHTLGLEHPEVTDIRGEGVPGIMYPRGTIVDPPFQYDPTVLPYQNGGTMNPFTRKVLLKDVEQLRLHRLRFDERGFAILGDFTSVWHDAHPQ